MKIKVNKIIIEGVDKTGKDLIAKYLIQMCNHKYEIHARGVISNKVYEILFNREEYDYDLDDNTLYVLLEAYPEDLEIRFKITGEKEIDIKHHLGTFRDVFDNMTVGKHALAFNTSAITPYKISETILDYLKNING